MSFFTPKQHIFYQLFSEINKNVGQIVHLFDDLSKEFKDFDSYSKKAKEIEHRADVNTHAIIERLNKTFITPFDREDIYHLAGEMDNIVDLIDQAIHNMQVYHLTHNHPAIRQFSHLFIQATGCLSQLLECLENRKLTVNLTHAKVKMHELEDEADEIFSKTLDELFQNHPDAITLIKLKDIVEILEDVMDKFQQVGDIIEGIIVKSS